MTTRLNQSQQIEVLIDSLQGYALMVVPALVDGGYTVKLNPQQTDLIQSILNQVQALNDSLSSSGQTVQQLNGLINQIQGLRDVELVEIADKLQALSQLAAIAESSTQILAAIDGLIDAIGNIQSGGGVVAGVQSIASVTLSAANTQYTHLIPAGTVRYAFSCRGDETRSDPMGSVRFSWLPGKVAAGAGGLGVDNYDVLPPENEESADQVFAADTLIYFAGDTPGIVLNVRRWGNANP